MTPDEALQMAAVLALAHVAAAVLNRLLVRFWPRDKDGNPL